MKKKSLTTSENTAIVFVFGHVDVPIGYSSNSSQGASNMDQIICSQAPIIKSVWF